MRAYMYICTRACMLGYACADAGSGFEDVTSRVGLGPSKHGSGAAWLDIDSDGDLDLYVTTVGHTRHYLYVNKVHSFYNIPGFEFASSAVAPSYSFTIHLHLGYPD